MEYKVAQFESLTPQEVYLILQLRAAVFVVEQECPYLDPDGKDQEALHVLGFDAGNLVAYTRILTPGKDGADCSIGRVVVDPQHRGAGSGRELMLKSMETAQEHLGCESIHLSAQGYLREFYESLEFHAYGEPYLEDDIPHIAMMRRY
ncbi:ElaA protein [Robiginitalea myxolifaciens]|uniref:ElaA protein n=1 Tax=Robiginitalea myxolifaciens TaxID=400055 RepID=A0A1I6G3D9_9FLAO|nr:GNAT family N-acetyltransferase [Robiginitalea myxolifaciens]SFR36706.1 ElaA protein [Robiginitalea myxolifaciens]